MQLEVALMPARTIKVTVLNPKGRPSVDAEVGLVTAARPLTVYRGHLRANFNIGLLRVDAQGAFSLPPDDSITRVIAINAEGLAQASPAALLREPTLQLQLFGGLEGRWLAGNLPVPGKELVLSGELALDGKDFSATTDDQGRFVFGQVPPGTYRLNRYVPDANGLGGRLKPLAEAEVLPGETTRVTVGAGHLVKVRLRWPADLVPDKSKPTVVFMTTQGLQPPAAITKDPQALSQWFQSPEVVASMRSVRNYELVEGPDGLWTSEAVPAGTVYVLGARVSDNSAPDAPTPPIATGAISVTIPAEPSTGQLDAGEIVLRRVEAGR